MFEEGMILSPDGHCRPFDTDARGTRGGSGAGIVVLKRLSDALADRDTIHAVIRGAAVNNDGREKPVLLPRASTDRLKRSPRRKLWPILIRELSPISKLTALERHLADPIEIAALTKVFRAARR